jgi:hypothetical protein
LYTPPPPSLPLKSAYSWEQKRKYYSSHLDHRFLYVKHIIWLHNELGIKFNLPWELKLGSQSYWGEWEKNHSSPNGTWQMQGWF